MLRRFSTVFGPALLGWLLMVLSWVNDPPSPSLVGTASYGHNEPGSLPNMSIWLLFELAVVLAVAQPWRSDLVAYRRRANAAAVMSAVWFVLLSIASMHAGGVVLGHNLWLLLLAIALPLGGPLRIRGDPTAD
jgi:hypothetical protein